MSNPRPGPGHGPQLGPRQILIRHIELMDAAQLSSLQQDCIKNVTIMTGAAMAGVSLAGPEASFPAAIIAVIATLSTDPACISAIQSAYNSVTSEGDAGDDDDGDDDDGDEDDGDDDDHGDDDHGGEVARDPRDDIDLPSQVGGPRPSSAKLIEALERRLELPQASEKDNDSR